MASAKVILHKATKSRKLNGAYPLALRIIKDRRTKYIFLGVYVQEIDWDEIPQKVKKSHKNATHINNLILKKLGKTNDILIESDAQETNVSALQVKKQLKRSGSRISFQEFAGQHYEELISQGKYKVAYSNRSRISNFKNFLNNEEILFPDITVSLLEKFKIYLNATCESSPRTVMNHLLLIRTLYNKAIREGIVDIRHYPFGRDKIKIRMPESIKIGLDEEEVKKLVALPLDEGSSLFHTRSAWLFSLYFAGMRISDVLNAKWSDFSEGRLNYRMGKNNKVVSVKIPEKLQSILAYYELDKKTKNDFVFPDLKSADRNNKKDIYVKTNTACKRFNNHLKILATKAEIKKHISNHIARHTFGNIAGDKISPQMLQKLYRHSDIRTTMGYQANFIHKTADEALESVINF